MRRTVMVLEKIRKENDIKQLDKEQLKSGSS